MRFAYFYRHYACSCQPIVFLRSVLVSYSPIVLPRFDNLTAIKVVLEIHDAVKRSTSSAALIYSIASSLAGQSTIQPSTMPKTLIPPPPRLEHHSPIESALSLTPLAPIGPDIFTNARPLWHPPGARGIFGGAAIAQCLSAAMATVDSTVYTVHSMHCYFVLAGDGETPVVYYVERVRDGKSFVTRTVQARQRGKVIL